MPRKSLGMHQHNIALIRFGNIVNRNILSYLYQVHTIYNEQKPLHGTNNSIWSKNQNFVNLIQYYIRSLKRLHYTTHKEHKNTCRTVFTWIHFFLYSIYVFSFFCWRGATGGASTSYRGRSNYDFLNKNISTMTMMWEGDSHCKKLKIITSLIHYQMHIFMYYCACILGVWKNSETHAKCTCTLSSRDL